MTEQREIYIAGVRVDNLGTDQLAQMMAEWEQHRSERSYQCTALEVEVIDLRREKARIQQELYEKEKLLAKAKQLVREATAALKTLNALYWQSKRGT